MASNPSTYKRLMVQKLTSNFREAVEIETAEMCHPKKGEVCIKNKYVGVNASDVYMIEGRYSTSPKPPFGVGFEKGVDVIWETIGGKVFEDCLKNLAIRGRLLIIGNTSSYKSEDRAAMEKRDISDLPEQLLFKSASVTAFLLLHFGECFASYFKYLSESLEAGKLKVVLDNGEKSTGKEFSGMEGIIRGVEHLQAGKNVGKVYTRVS